MEIESNGAQLRTTENNYNSELQLTTIFGLPFTNDLV